MHLFLDTDIGTDVDDALALGVILGSPEFTLVGVSTVYGDTLLRAQLTSRLARIADPEFAVPISAGESQTRSGKPVWWPGHEGKLFDDLAEERIDQTRDGVHELVSAARTYSGELVVLAIGPLTNIAAALDRDPEFETNVKSVVIMGGDFSAEGRQAEHNFVSDITAAQRVFGSRLPVAIGGLDLTMQMRVGPADVATIAAAGEFGRAIEAEIAQWWEFHGEAWNTPHDPILVAWLLHPELFQTRQATLAVDDEGISRDESSTEGEATIITGMNVEAVVHLIVQRICRASVV